MKKLMLYFLVLACLFCVTACDDDDDALQGITGTVAFASYDCEVVLTPYTPPMGGEPAVFKSSISASDISLSGALKGKKVDKVTFVDSSTVKVYLTGKTTNVPGEDDYGVITVSKKALENDYDCFATVDVKLAHIVVGGLMKNSITNNYDATLRLDVGTFATDVGLSDVTLAEGTTGTIEKVSVQDNELYVRVLNASKNPRIVLNARTTSFNKEITIELSNYYSVCLE